MKARRLSAVAACVALAGFLGGCGVAAAPRVQEVSGMVDAPCPDPGLGGTAQATVPTAAAPPAAANPAAAGRVSSCVVHVILLNNGGAGAAAVTLEMAVKGADGKATDPAHCLQAIPTIAAGGYAEVTCSFAVKAGQTVTTAPRISDLSVSPATGGSSAGGGLSDLFAGATALLALATLWVAVQTRRLTAVVNSLAPGKGLNDAASPPGVVGPAALDLEVPRLPS